MFVVASAAYAECIGSLGCVRGALGWRMPPGPAGEGECDERGMLIGVALCCSRCSTAASMGAWRLEASDHVEDREPCEIGDGREVDARKAEWWEDEKACGHSPTPNVPCDLSSTAWEPVSARKGSNESWKPPRLAAVPKPLAIPRPSVPSMNCCSTPAGRLGVCCEYGEPMVEELALWAEAPEGSENVAEAWSRDCETEGEAEGMETGNSAEAPSGPTLLKVS